MTTKDILTEYNKRKSIRATAQELGISEGVVRKVLIGYGVISTPRTRRIMELSATGMPEKDIAELLGISLSCVNANTPYTKGTYLTPTKSRNAEAIKLCRERKRSNGD